LRKALQRRDCRHRALAILAAGLILRRRRKIKRQGAYLNQDSEALNKQQNAQEPDGYAPFTMGALGGSANLFADARSEEVKVESTAQHSRETGTYPAGLPPTREGEAISTAAGTPSPMERERKPSDAPYTPELEDTLNSLPPSSADTNTRPSTPTSTSASVSATATTSTTTTTTTTTAELEGERRRVHDVDVGRLEEIEEVDLLPPMYDPGWREEL
jgi:hypothetical protein